MQANLDINISFYCRGNRLNKIGESPIILRIRYRTQKREIYSGLFCPAAFWNADFDKVSPKFKPGITINERLDRMRHKVATVFERLKYENEDFTIDELVDLVRGKKAPPQTIMDYTQLKLKEIEEEVGIKISKTTLYKYNRTVRYLKEFIYHNSRQNNIPVSRINETFVEGFYKFLCKQKGQSNNSAAALMSCFNRILQPAIKKGVLKRNPITDQVLSREPVHREYLEMEEIKRIEELQNLTQSLDHKRNVFLFAIYTGLAYADIAALKSHQIRKDNNNEYYISKGREKNNSISIVPLLPAAVRLLKKYTKTGDIRDFEWKITSNQKMNKGLKEIAIKANIKRNLFMHLARHTFATTITLTNGVSIESVSKMLGHTSLKHTQIYAKVVSQKVKNEMKTLADIFH